MAAALSASETAKNLNLNNFRIAVSKDQTNPTGAETLRWTTSNFRMVDEEHLYPSFEEDILKDSKGRDKQRLCPSSST